MTLVFAIMHLYNALKKNFLLFLPIPFLYFFFNLESEIRQNGRRHQYVLALCALLTGVILKGLGLRKIVFYSCDECAFCFTFV